VEIDPAPFQAALEQAQANKLKDQAQLENARLDLDRAARLVKSGATSLPEQGHESVAAGRAGGACERNSPAACRGMRIPGSAQNQHERGARP
jgi:multidrug resistance efflux pump